MDLVIVPAPTDLDAALAALRGGDGWQAGLAAANQVRLAQGRNPYTRWTLRTALKAAGQLQAFPRSPVRGRRPRKPDLTQEECKLARAALAAPAGRRVQRWRNAVCAINAGRAPKDWISERTLRDRLRHLDGGAP